MRLRWKTAAKFPNGDVSSIKAEHYHICKNFLDGATLYCLYDGDRIAGWDQDLEPLQEEAERLYLIEVSIQA